MYLAVILWIAVSHMNVEKVTLILKVIFKRKTLFEKIIFGSGLIGSNCSWTNYQDDWEYYNNPFEFNSGISGVYSTYQNDTKGIRKWKFKFCQVYPKNVFFAFDFVSIFSFCLIAINVKKTDGHLVFSLMIPLWISKCQMGLSLLELKKRKQVRRSKRSSIKLMLKRTT